MKRSKGKYKSKPIWEAFPPRYETRERAEKALETWDPGVPPCVQEGTVVRVNQAYIDAPWELRVVEVDPKTKDPIPWW